MIASNADELPVAVHTLIDQATASFRASGKRSTDIRSFLRGYWQVAVTPAIAAHREDFLTLAEDVCRGGAPRGFERHPIPAHAGGAA